MAIKGIPTTYKGINFRSRLEARWAAFFDLLQWEWEYEPLDCEGWIPDFALRTPGDYVLVEVKPVTYFPTAIAEEIDSAEKDHEAVIVGIGPFKSAFEGLSLGWMREVYPPGFWSSGDKWHSCWDEAIMGRWIGSESSAKNPQGLFGFCHQLQSWHDRITGCYDGGACGGSGGFQSSIVLALWAKAQNLVQWKAIKPADDFVIPPGFPDNRGKSITELFIR